MAQGVVADNWSLQEISTLLQNGLEADDAGEIVLENGIHTYKAIAGAIVQTEALFDFLVDLILRDEILVEEQFTHTWESFQSPLLEAKALGIVKAYPFLTEPEKIAGPRDRIVQYLCSTESLKVAHQANVEGWNRHKETPDQLLSITLWGGAGMCARSFVYEKSYTPHPLRKRLFINSGFMLPAADAVHQLITFLDDQKVQVSKKIYGNDSLFSARINLPAIPLRVIQESNSVDQLISVALQMRDDFSSLREWLKVFQNAIANDDAQKLLTYRKELDSVRQYVTSKLGMGSSDKPVTMEVGMGILKISTKGNPIESLKNQFGIRATLNKLIFGSNGRPEIAKYINMFGERGTTIGYELERQFTKNI